MNDYDKAGRYLVKRDPSGFFRWLLAIAGIFVVGVPVLTGLLAALSGRAQTPPGERPTFEVASVKRRKEIRSGLRLPTFSNDRFTFSGPLLPLIATASVTYVHIAASLSLA